MAQLISVKLSRFDGSPWGFRLQGGKDFGTPLIVQKVSLGFDYLLTSFVKTGGISVCYDDIYLRRFGLFR